MTHYVRPLSLAWAGPKTSSLSIARARPTYGNATHANAISLGIVLRFLAGRRPKATLLPFPRKSGQLPPAA